LSRPVLAPGSALLPYTTLFRSLGAPPAALPWGSQDRVHPHHRLPRRTVPDARGRRVRDRRLGRLVQQPAPPWHARDAHPDRVRDAPLRGPHPRARTHKVAAENLGRFTWAPGMIPAAACGPGLSRPSPRTGLFISTMPSCRPASRLATFRCSSSGTARSLPWSPPTTCTWAWTTGMAEEAPGGRRLPWAIWSGGPGTPSQAGGCARSKGWWRHPGGRDGWTRA